jgi:hypothetical protein
MHISALVPTSRVVLEGGVVNATGVPQTKVTLGGKLPMHVHAPILLCVWTEAGNDPNPCIYVQVRDPNGQKRGDVELVWKWDDVEGHPCKWRVFDLMMPFLAFESGVYTFGVYNHPDDAETDHWFPLPILFDEQ